jgi:hypothetical protein
MGVRILVVIEMTNRLFSVGRYLRGGYNANCALGAVDVILKGTLMLWGSFVGTSKVVEVRY